MAITDRYTLRDKYTFDGQECMNVYYYRQDDGEDGAEELATGFMTDVLPEILDIQSDTVVHTEIEVTNEDDPNDFFTIGDPQPNTGTLAGEVYPRFNAWAFKYNRSSRLYRNGWKRIAGITEGTARGSAPQPGFEAVLNDTAAALGADIVTGAGRFRPVIAVIGPPPGNDPPTAGDITSVSFSKVTSQNSRKR